MDTLGGSPLGAYGRLAERVAGNGYWITPTKGKRPVKDNWPSASHVPADAQRFSRCNLGILCKRTPFFDIDVDHEGGARAISEMLDRRGITIRRFGQGHRFGVPFQTHEPFSKIAITMIAPDGATVKLEFLGNGQQFVAYGVHPDTGKEYAWRNGEPLAIPADELPIVTAVGARELIEDARKVLLARGFKDTGANPRSIGTARGGIRRLAEPLPPIDGPTDAPWDLVEALRWCDPVEYGSWIAVSHALKQAELDGASWAFELWCAWSSYGPFNKEQDDEARWEGFRTSRTELGAIFKAVGLRRRVATASRETGSLVEGEVEISPIVCATDVRAEPVSWAWRYRLAYGKLHLVAGRPSTAKSTLALDLAARMSAGRVWPDGTRSEEKKVILWSGEDDYADTIKPRLMAAGANLDNIFFVNGTVRQTNTHDGQMTCRFFDPATDMPILEALASKLGDVGMVIVDSVMSTTKRDSHKNAEVRQDLQPLVDMLRRLRAVGVGITHFTKGTEGRDPIERVNASIAFAAVARVIFATVKQRDVVNDFRVVIAKSNLGPEGGGFRYHVEVVEIAVDEHRVETTKVCWGRPLEGDARNSLLKPRENPAVVRPNSSTRHAAYCGECCRMEKRGLPISRRQQKGMESAGGQSSVQRRLSALSRFSRRSLGRGTGDSLPILASRTPRRARDRNRHIADATAWATGVLVAIAHQCCVCAAPIRFWRRGSGGRGAGGASFATRYSAAITTASVKPERQKDLAMCKSSAGAVFGPGRQ